MAFLPQELIRRKRDGATLSAEEITFFVRGLSDRTIGDAQVAAFAMAVYFAGLTREECVALTLAMRDSGEVLRWDGPALDGPILDKHSTGGVGDLVSLILAPLLAACGAYVPMISGRGLGHTGGTLDKLAAIPGYEVAPDTARFQQVVRDVGCAIIGQTGRLAPADARLYAIRDVTATVESIGLITASILAKKLAAGLDALVMDVKVGNGAFMATREAARGLARSIVDTATGAGTPTTALLTDMNQGLASSAGNALEVREAITFLTSSQRHPRLAEVTFALARELLLAGGLSATDAEAAARLDAALATGRAAERFAAMVHALGGPPDILTRAEHHLPRAPVVLAVAPTRAGIVTAVQTRELGLAVVSLGGGRTRPDQTIDPAVGLSDLCGPGDAVDSDRPLAVVHARNDADAERATAQVRAAFTLGDTPPVSTPIVHERIAPAP